MSSIDTRLQKMERLLRMEVGDGTSHEERLDGIYRAIHGKEPVAANDSVKHRLAVCECELLLKRLPTLRYDRDALWEMMEHVFNEG